eukprot:861838-Pyramimonas_sp.AAC.1
MDTMAAFARRQRSLKLPKLFARQIKVAWPLCPLLNRIPSSVVALGLPRKHVPSQILRQGRALLEISEQRALTRSIVDRWTRDSSRLRWVSPE